MTYAVRIIYSENSIFNYVSKSRNDFIMQEVAKGNFPNDTWSWQIISSQNAREFFAGDFPPEVQTSFDRHLTAIAATRAGETSYYSSGATGRPEFLSIAWEYLTHNAQSVEEWETPFIIMDEAGAEQGRYDAIFDALAAAESLPECEIHLPAPDSSTDNPPLFTF